MMNKALFGLAVLVFSLLTFQTATRVPFRTGVATDTLQSRTESLYPVVNDSLGLVGRVMKYNNVLTEGYGVPAIVDYASASSTAITSATNITGTQAAGLYRVGVYLECIAEDTGADSVYAKISWTNAATATVYDSTVWLGMSDSSKYLHKVFVVYNNGSDTMTYQTVMDTDAADGEYLLKVVTERLN